MKYEVFRREAVVIVNFKQNKRSGSLLLQNPVHIQPLKRTIFTYTPVMEKNDLFQKNVVSSLQFVITSVFISASVYTSL